MDHPLMLQLRERLASGLRRRAITTCSQWAESYLREFGFPVALVIIFVWWTYKREQRLTDRLDKVQDAYTKTLTTIVADNTSAMNALTAILKDRPCIIKGER